MHPKFAKRTIMTNKNGSWQPKFFVNKDFKTNSQKKTISKNLKNGVKAQKIVCTVMLICLIHYEACF
jgi:hypothetical protein